MVKSFKCWGKDCAKEVEKAKRNTSFQLRKGKAPLHPLGSVWDNKAAAFLISALWSQPRQEKSAFQMAYFKVHSTQGPSCYWFASGGVTASLSTALLTGTIHWASFKVKGKWMGHLSSGATGEGVGLHLLAMPQRFYEGDWWPFQDLPSFCGFPWGHPEKKELGLCCQIPSRWLSFHSPSAVIPLHSVRLWPPAAGLGRTHLLLPLNLYLWASLTREGRAWRGHRPQKGGRSVNKGRNVLMWLDMAGLPFIAKESKLGYVAVFMYGMLYFFQPYGLAWKAVAPCTSSESWDTMLQLSSPCQGGFQLSRTSWASTEQLSIPKRGWWFSAGCLL